MMKAMVLKQNGSLSYMDVQEPTLAVDEYLLRVSAAGICNSDITRAFNNRAYSYPIIMGHEFSGTIVASGGAATQYSLGQRVVVFPLIPCFVCASCTQRIWNRCDRYDYYGSRRDGAFSELISVKEWNVLPIPEACDPHLAALTEPLAVAFHALKAIPKESRGKLAVIGAGFIGLSLAHLAIKEYRFAKIAMFDRNRFKLDIGRSKGLSTTLLPPSNEMLETPSEVSRAYDVVVVAAGTVDMFRYSLALAADGARVIWLGNIEGALDLSEGEVSSILRREISIRGVWNSDYQPAGPSDWSSALEVLSAEEWVDSLVTHRISLVEAPDILQELNEIKQRWRPHSYLKGCVLID
jgi:L-iditol 2-dehydrogenase